MIEKMDILKLQEEGLQFPAFNQEEAWKLGCYMVDYAKRNQIVIAVSIRMNSGCIVFQHCPDGTNALNQRWMERKFNMVRLTEHASLRTALEWQSENQSAETHGMDGKEYAVCGGGFPIRIKGTENCLGAIIASNLFHIADHEFIICCLKEYLNCPDVPNYPYEIP